jgi:hypothetical protein
MVEVRGPRAFGMAAVALAGCGRIAFDSPPEDGATGVAASGLHALCAFTQRTVIDNGLTVDDGVGALLDASLSTGCSNAPITRTVSQDDPGVLDPVTGRPLVAANDLVVIGGGDGPNHAIAYLLRDDTPVTWSSSPTPNYRERATGRTLAMGPVTDAHDYALVMVVVEPIGGSRILSASGMNVNGTLAAGYWFQHEIAPAITTDDEMWTLVEWTNADSDPTPSAGDTFVVLASGR